jgi:hypothetical protein
MSLDTFYVHLPSDTINPYYPNKSNSFRITLPKPLRLNGVWLCGLSSIIYPRSYAAIGTTREQEIQVEIRDPHYEKVYHLEKVHIKIPSGTYSTSEGLSHAINTAIANKVDELRRSAPTRLRKRAATDDDTPPAESAQLYTQRPTAEDVEREKMNITRQRQPNDEIIVKYFDESGILRWNEVELPAVRRSRDTAQHELLHVQRIGSEIRQLLMDDRGNFLMQRGINPSSTSNFQLVGGPRKYPDPAKWTKIKRFVRRNSGEQIDLFTNINNDLYFHWDNGNLFYREPSTPTVPISSIQLPPLVSEVKPEAESPKSVPAEPGPETSTATAKPPPAVTEGSPTTEPPPAVTEGPPAVKPPPVVTEGPPTAASKPEGDTVQTELADAAVPSPQDTGKKDEAKAVVVTETKEDSRQKVLTADELARLSEQKERERLKKVEEDETRQKPLSDHELAELHGGGPAQPPIAEGTRQVEKRIGRVADGEVIENTDNERNVPLWQKLSEFQVNFDPDINRFVVKLGHWNRWCHFTPQLGYALGFSVDKWIVYPFVEASHPPDLQAGIHHMYVYSNELTENVMVGDKMASLLRIVTIKGEHEDIIEETYDTPFMSRVVASEVTEIGIEIRTADGRLLPFEWGSVIVVLVFKKALLM